MPWNRRNGGGALVCLFPYAFRAFAAGNWQDGDQWNKADDPWNKADTEDESLVAPFET